MVSMQSCAAATFKTSCNEMLSKFRNVSDFVEAGERAHWDWFVNQCGHWHWINFVLLKIIFHFIHVNATMIKKKSKVLKLFSNQISAGEIFPKSRLKCQLFIFSLFILYHHLHSSIKKSRKSDKSNWLITSKTAEINQATGSFYPDGIHDDRRPR